MRFNWLAVWLVALLLLTSLVGCGGGGGGNGGSTPITVGVVPDIVPLTTGETQQFTADVTGSNVNQAVNWIVVEGNAGGTITADGLYKAPATAGTYHVEAISKARPSAIGTAIITVTAPAQTGSIQGTIQ